DKENAQFCAFSTLQTPKGAQKSGIFAVKGRKNPQVPQAPGSLSRFIPPPLFRRGCQEACRRLTVPFPVPLYFCLVFLFVCGLAGCAPGKLAGAEIRVERAGTEAALLKVELARTPEERSRGLMHRKNLADGEGMLFIFERDQALSFWMKDTLIPLSIAFIASDGRIVEIRDMRPLDLNPVKSSRSVRYALEVPQGWFERAGIKPGDTVKF
ncbi:MAG: DUF192 domain-containing protein, partial [Treponema sp.]|nr:DUF192 domain-containing protein [Treponema sp.]